jgi:sugar/nucleoside kinase (ribokinase family)
MPDVVSIGISVMDVPARPVGPQVFEHDSTRVESVRMLPGGDALNVAVALSKMGVSSGLVTKMGRDAASEVLLSSLERAGVDTRGVVRDSAHTTSTVLVLIGEDGERHFVTTKGAHHYFTRHDIDWDYLRRAKVVEISSLFGLTEFGVDEVAAVLEFCRDNGITTCMDFMYDKTGERVVRVAEVMPLIDYALPSRVEAQQMSGGRTVGEMAEKLRGMGCGNVIIKNGAEGCYLNTEGVERSIAAPKVKAVYSTGAGDSFVAGFIFGLLRDWDVETCAEFGSTVGALNCREIGATAGVPDAEEAAQYYPERYRGPH